MLTIYWLFQKVLKPKDMGGYVTSLFYSNFNLEPRIFPLQAVLLVKKEKNVLVNYVSILSITPVLQGLE